MFQTPNRDYTACALTVLILVVVDPSVSAVGNEAESEAVLAQDAQ